MTLPQIAAVLAAWFVLSIPIGLLIGQALRHRGIDLAPIPDESIPALERIHERRR